MPGSVCWIVVLLLLAVHRSCSGELPNFHCTDESKITLRQVCDGTMDCPDGSDEVRPLCKHTSCPVLRSFQCMYGACVSKTVVCDGKLDCADGSDESHCGHENDSCNYTEFQCGSGECISQRKLCDGRIDCTDMSDETSTTCSDFPCPSHAYQCSTGSCLPKLSLCNGVTECPDGSDESALSCPHLYTCHHHQENCNMTHTCGLGEWRCSSGQCVGPRDVCNGHLDCNDGSDETMDLCFDQVCPKNMFRCHYGGCINSNLTCNNEPDCSDWSDETPDICGQNENGGGCSLPAPSAHARYVASNCPSCRPGAMVTQYQVLNYSCEVGHTLQGSVSVYCHNSVWVPRLPTCGPVSGAVTCPAIVSPRLTVSCESHWGNRKGWLPCDSPLPVGTVARYQCRRYYQPDGSEHEDNTEAECLRSGHWSRELLRCKPECGHIGTEVTPLVVHGLSAPFGFYPWQSALYVLQAGNWSFWCGGSLLNENAVITAGHCVWKVSPGTLRVALGKYYRDFNKQQDFTQIRDVKEIVIQPAYQDLGGNYGSDIAVLLMASPIEFSPVVRPVCVDWELDHMSRDLADGNFGTVAGWGVNENDTFSDSLRSTQLEVVSDKKCLSEQPRDFKKYVTYTSFCAGYRNGTGVCNGDSGGGLVFHGPDPNSKWFLQGIVSVSPRRRGTSLCNPTYYTVFTKVGVYVRWLQSVLAPLEPPTLKNTTEGEALIHHLHF